MYDPVPETFTRVDLVRFEVFWVKLLSMQPSGSGQMVAAECELVSGDNSKIFCSCRFVMIFLYQESVLQRWVISRA